MRQPVDWVSPHPDLKGLRVSVRTVSLLPLASGKQGGIHHCHTLRLSFPPRGATRRTCRFALIAEVDQFPAGQARRGFLAV